MKTHKKGDEEYEARMKGLMCGVTTVGRLPGSTFSITVKGLAHYTSIPAHLLKPGKKLDKVRWKKNIPTHPIKRSVNSLFSDLQLCNNFH